MSDKIGINTLVFFKSDCVLKIKKSFFVNYKLISIFVPVNIQLMPTNPKHISVYILSKMGVIVERETTPKKSYKIIFHFLIRANDSLREICYSLNRARYSHTEARHSLMGASNSLSGIFHSRYRAKHWLTGASYWLSRARHSLRGIYYSHMGASYSRSRIFHSLTGANLSLS